MLHPEKQKQMAVRINARETITMAVSHSSMASKPVEVAALIDEAATELAKV